MSHDAEDIILDKAQALLEMKHYYEAIKEIRQMVFSELLSLVQHFIMITKREYLYLSVTRV